MRSKEETPSTTTGSRVPFWDNARFVCIVLVVMGHGIQRLTLDYEPAQVLYLVIYSFHMPAFAVMSGFFSRSEAPDKRRMARLVTDILVPYLIFETLWSLLNFALGRGLDLNPTQASWTLWFLLALGVFRLVLPYLALLRWPLLFSVAASVCVGYFANVDSTFSLARAIGILPFFVLGWKLRVWKDAGRFDASAAPTWWMRTASIALFAGLIVSAAIFVANWRDVNVNGWLFYDSSYSTLDTSAWWAGGVRLGLLLVTTLIIAAFLTLIPRRGTWMTGFGRYTMYVYLLHSFVLYPLRESGLLQSSPDPLGWFAVMVVAAIGISVALSSRPVRKVFRPLIEPRVRWLFADRAQTDP